MNENAKKDPAPTLVVDSTGLVDAPHSAVRLTTSLSVADFHAFMGRKDTPARIEVVVKARVGRKTPQNLVDDLDQEANLDAVAATLLPRTLATAPGWLATVTARAVVNHIRRNAADAGWLEPEVEIEEVPGAPEDAEESPRWLLTEWLGASRGRPRDERGDAEDAGPGSEAKVSAAVAAASDARAAAGSWRRDPGRVGWVLLHGRDPNVAKPRPEGSGQQGVPGGTGPPELPGGNGVQPRP